MTVVTEIVKYPSINFKWNIQQFPQLRNPGNARVSGSIPGLERSSGEGIGYPLQYSWASLVAQLVKNPPAMQETWVWFPGLGRSPGEGKGYPLQYSGPENSMDCIVHGVAKSQTRLNDFHFQFQLSLWSNSHICTWLLENTTALTIRSFVSKAMSVFQHTV